MYIPEPGDLVRCITTDGVKRLGVVVAASGTVLTCQLLGGGLTIASMDFTCDTASPPTTPGSWHLYDSNELAPVISTFEEVNNDTWTYTNDGNGRVSQQKYTNATSGLKRTTEDYTYDGNGLVLTKVLKIYAYNGTTIIGQYTTTFTNSGGVAISSHIVKDV